MMGISNIRWDFGNGETSSLSSPSVVYNSGSYDVTLRYTNDVGVESEVVKRVYINVDESSKSLNNWDALNSIESLHYGWKDEHGFGWSRNKRDSWVVPTTSSSVYTINEDGVDRTVVWDIYDAKPYVINTLEGHRQPAIYKDKADIDGTGGVEFPTSMRFTEVTGDMTHYDISHLETNVLFRPEIISDESMVRIFK
jgi:hypothetical protein